MLTQEEIGQAVFELDLYGFTILPPLIEARVAAAMCELLDAADEQRGTDYSYDNAYARHLICAAAVGRDFMSLIDHPDVLGILKHALDEDLVLGSVNARVVRPGDPAQGLHSDIPRVHRRIIGQPVMMQVVWMLDGFTNKNGATYIVPGSHRHPESYPPAGRAIPHIVQATGAPGSVLIFNGQCWHGGGANISQKRRRAVFGHYRLDAWMRFQTDPSSYFDLEQWKQMTPRQRQLLRMEHGLDQKTAADYYPDQMRDKRYD